MVMNIIIHVSGHFHLSGHLSFWLVPSCPDNRGSTVSVYLPAVLPCAIGQMDQILGNRVYHYF